MTRMRMTCALALLMLLAASGCARDTVEKQPLRAVYMPTFAKVPPREPAAQTVRSLVADWRGGSGERFRRDVLSTQGLAAAIALAVILIVAWDYRRLSNPRNIDLLLMYGAGLLLFDVMRFFPVLRHPSYLNLLDWVFTGVFITSLALLSRAVWTVVRGRTISWIPNLGTRPLAALAALLLGVNIWIALARPPDDAGWFVNLGAQRLRERGRLPYGDPLLTATPGAAYGPLLYVAHVPFQLLLSPRPVNAVSPSRPDLDSEPPYYLPPLLATQFCTAVFHAIGVIALFFAARRLSDVRAALGIVCLYCGSLGVLGIGGLDESVTGITFASHIAPASMTLAAFATLRRPALSGTLLAASVGVGFYPAFMVPAWLGHYWDDTSRRIRFVVGFGVAAALIAGSVYALSRPAGERSRIGTIVYDTVGHHTEPAGYGSSPFGFWGQREGIRRLLGSPLVGTAGTTSPAWLAFAALIGATFFLARGRSQADLALLAAAVAIGATLVKPHATGTYIAWYYPLLLLGFFAGHGTQFGAHDRPRRGSPMRVRHSSARGFTVRNEPWSRRHRTLRLEVDAPADQPRPGWRQRFA